jgi:disulfide bond formation protein DsbB
MMSFLKKNLIQIAFAQALMAMLGSLYFSEVLQFPPCVLCWYQRIAFYPLVLLLGIGIYRQDKTVYWYALPLAIIGWVISIYHNLLYYKILPESIQPCMLGVSCTTKFIEWFGFVTIPFLSFIAFSVIIVCLLVYKRLVKKENKN